MYLWLEEMGLINQPPETKEDQIKEFETHLKCIAARNRLTMKRRHDNLKKRGKAV